MTFMLDRVASEDFWLQESMLLVFARLEGDILWSHITHLHGVFMRCLGNVGSADVRIAALLAAIHCIQCLKSLSDRDMFQDLLPGVMQSLEIKVLNDGDEATAQEVLNNGDEATALEVLNNGDEATAQEVLNDGDEALKLLIELAKTEPRFFKGHLVVVAEGICGLPRPIVYRSGQGIWRLSLVGKEGLHRLATALGGKIAYKQLSKYLAKPDDKWQYHAAPDHKFALAQIVGRSKVMIPNFEQVVSMVLISFQDRDHPRVRWAAINAIGELYLDSQYPYQYHTFVLPALAEAIYKDPDPRVRLAAINATGQLPADLDLDLEEIKYEFGELLAKTISKNVDAHVRLAAINANNLDSQYPYQYHTFVLPALAEAIYKDPDPRVRLAAINATGQLPADLDLDLEV
ncbi:ran-binding protein 6 [Artemisia annua]|uniref:Ran-binding protein 6 n=1 Tax=Artemisia annua TaxID=35608 RepID=A0A2U1LIT7_ARTAN|nr:ran-binding protein 6 [Artemisia annua]